MEFNNNQLSSCVVVLICHHSIDRTVSAFSFYEELTKERGYVKPMLPPGRTYLACFISILKWSRGRRQGHRNFIDSGDDTNRRKLAMQDQE